MIAKFNNLIFFLFAFSVTTFAQYELKDNKFDISGKIGDKDTGLLRFMYTDQYNRPHVDSFQLKNGGFHLSGTVNGVSEALIWTDIHNKNFDDVTVIRFLLEGRQIKIYKKNDKSLAEIKGSKSQDEKKTWDSVKSKSVSVREQHLNALQPIYKSLASNPTPELRHQIDSLESLWAAAVAEIKYLDVGYIFSHPNSSLSAFLLYRNLRKLPIDSLEMFYRRMTNKMKSTTIGHDILAYIYTLTNNNKFRSTYPLINAKVNQQLERMNSIYDLELRDTSGRLFDWKICKGKYTLLDFWGSWCGPCIANIPDLRNLIKEFKGDSLVVLSISLDKDLQTWKSSIIKYNFPGLQLSDLKGLEGLAATFSKVLWVPKYLLSDQTGKIINYDMPQASNPDLKKILKTILN